MISEVTPSPQMPGETDECKSLFVELVLFCPRSFFSLSCYFYCYFGILLLFIFSSYLIFTVDTSSHRSTSTGTTIVIDRTQHFRSTPMPTTQLHTQTSIFYNTQSSIFSRFHEHTSTPVITWSTIHASTPLSTQSRTRVHVSVPLRTQSWAPLTTPPHYSG